MGHYNVLRTTLPPEYLAVGIIKGGQTVMHVNQDRVSEDEMMEACQDMQRRQVARQWLPTTTETRRQFGL